MRLLLPPAKGPTGSTVHSPQGPAVVPKAKSILVARLCRSSLPWMAKGRIRVHSTRHWIFWQMHSRSSPLLKGGVCDPPVLHLPLPSSLTQPGQVQHWSLLAVSQSHTSKGMH